MIRRGARADAEVGDRIYLFKKLPILHATYQVRLLSARALQEGKALVIRVPHGFAEGPSLKALIEAYPRTIRVERI